jgi:hypothetical protein
MRLVHIFEMRNGKTSKEIVFDMGPPCINNAEILSAPNLQSFRRRNFCTLTEIFRTV